jgi:hypothetical protein
MGLTIYRNLKQYLSTFELIFCHIVEKYSRMLWQKKNLMKEVSRVLCFYLQISHFTNIAWIASQGGFWGPVPLVFAFGTNLRTSTHIELKLTTGNWNTASNTHEAF